MSTTTKSNVKSLSKGKPELKQPTPITCAKFVPQQNAN